MSDTPDWVTETPSTEAIHTRPPSAGGQFTTPFTPAKLLEIGGQLIEQIVSKVVGAIVGVFIPGGGTAVEQLSHWAFTTLPGLILAPLSTLVELLVVVLDSIPIIGEPLGNAVEDLANLFGLMKDRDVVQQASADTANAGVLLLNNRVNEIVAGGESFYDTFGRDLADFATDPDYDVEYAGGSGHLFLTVENDGRLRWHEVGFSDTRFIARRITPMGGNRVHMGCVIDDFTYGFAGNQAHIRLMARMDASRQNYVVATIGDDACEIGYVLAGTYTRLGAAESASQSAGDFWDLEVGLGADDWRFRLLQNNSVRVDRTDLGHVSQIDAVPDVTTGVYKFCAIGGDCAIGAGPFGTTYQIGMPDFQVIAGGEF